MELTYRSAAAGDTDRIVELWDANGLSAGGAVDATEIAERLRYDDGFFVVAEVDGWVVACAMGCYDGHRGWMKRVAVDPERQGAGIGQGIVGEVERRFLTAGITQLRLSAWSANERGCAFWERGGWEELPEIRYFTKELG